MKERQKLLLKKLHSVLVDINEEAMEDEEFYNFLSENYFFEENLEEIIIELKKLISEI